MSARMPGYTCLPGCQDTHVCQDKLVLGPLGEEGAKPTLLPERLADPEIIIFSGSANLAPRATTQGSFMSGSVDLAPE